jgi:hypothetical protein
MDWYEIQYLYPNSYEKFVRTLFPNIGIISLNILNYFDIKKLYSFFDNEQLYLNIEMNGKFVWSYTITMGNEGTLISNVNFANTREKIEELGFMECFKLLDKKMSCVI